MVLVDCAVDFFNRYTASTKLRQTRFDGGVIPPNRKPYGSQKNIYGLPP